MNTGKSLWPVYGLLSATLLLTGCFNEPQDESVSASEGRIKVRAPSSTAFRPDAAQ